MPNYLYIAGQEAGPIKVGFSASPKQRMRQLRTSSAADIKLVECFEVSGSAKEIEQAVHKSLGNGHMAREWFNVNAQTGRDAIMGASVSLGISVIKVAKIVEGEEIDGKRGRKKDPNAKQLLTLRLDPQVIEYFRATGEGWQTRINEILRKNAGL